MISGVPEHVDGRMIGITEAAGARLINRDRMWHYVEGIRNWNPIWPRHGIRILPGPSSMWFDASGRRLPSPLFPGSDTLGQLQYIMAHRLRLFVVRADAKHHQEGIRAVGLGTESRPHGQKLADDLKRATNKGAPAPVEAFKTHGADFVVRDNLADLVAGMNALTGDNLLQLETLQSQIEARDREISNPYVKDTQVMNIHNARRYIGDRLIRTAKPHRILDPAHGPLIAVKLNIVTRKTLGGFETDLDFAGVRPERPNHAGALCCWRSGRLWRRRRPRLSVAGRHIPRRLPVFRAQCGTRGGESRGVRRYETLIKPKGSSRDAEAVKTAQRVTSALNGTHLLAGFGEARIGVSIGIACGPEHAASADALMLLADKSLYAAKHSGLGIPRLYDDQLQYFTAGSPAEAPASRKGRGLSPARRGTELDQPI